MISKCFAGVLLGAPLSAAVLGLIAWLWPGTWEHVINLFLILFFPTWAAVMTATYLFRTPLRAWAWLGAGNAAAFGLLWLVRDLGAFS